MTTLAHTRPVLDPRLIYRLDAVVSAAAGIVLLALSGPATALLGWSIAPAVLIAIGVGLLPWAGFNYFIGRVTHPGIAIVRANIAGDVLWVIASLVLTLVHWPQLSVTGVLVLLGQAAVVCVVIAVKRLGAPHFQR